MCSSDPAERRATHLEAALTKLLMRALLFHCVITPFEAIILTDGCVRDVACMFTELRLTFLTKRSSISIQHLSRVCVRFRQIESWKCSAAGYEIC